jgi:DNA repair photolyase
MSLLPILPAPPQRTGLARLAALSPPVHQRAQVHYYALPSRSALNREASGRMPFAWTLNPYRGCEFGCKYCYARYTHEFMEMWESADFERKIYAKVSMPDLLRAELRQARDKGLPIALGTVTDPYQPAEKRFGITRRVLEAFTSITGLSLSLTTKSVLILRDLDLLVRLAQQHRFSVHMTIVTTDEHLARRLEPKAPPPARRFEAVARLTAAGVRVAVNAMPILPGITDSRAALEDLVRCAAASGASAVHCNLLFLKPSAMKEFMPFLQREFPHLVARYRQLYARSAYLRGEYRERISALMAELRKRYGLANRENLPAAAEGTPTYGAAGQLRLPLG